MKLYYFAGSCSLVPHIVARELGLEITPIAAPRAGEPGREAYIANVNPLGSVPALQLEKGTCLTQNIAIIEYLVALGAHAGKTNVVYPELGTLEHAEALRWLAHANADIHPAFGPLFRPQAFSSQASVYPEMAELAQQRLVGMYEQLNTAYGHKEWIANNQYSAADIYLYVTLRWAKAKGLSLTQWPQLCAMIARLELRSAVKLALTEQGLDSIS